MLLALMSTLACSAAPVPAPALDHLPPAPAPIELASGERGELAVTRVAHASVLLEIDGKTVLTDPWFTETPAYHHGEPIAYDVAHLPHLDAVVVSHGHYDHFDIDAFAAYPDESVPMIVEPSLVDRARAAGFTDVRGLPVWGDTDVDGLRITAAPGEHGVPEETYVLQGGGWTVYFGGDTERIPALDEIAARFPTIDLALLPVNGLRAVGKQVVMSAEQAGDLVGTLKPAVAIPIHYRFHGSGFTDTFLLGYDGTPERFVAAVAQDSPSTVTRILEPGERQAITER